MDIKVVIFLGCIALAASKDIKVGKEDGEKIFDENKEASPAIWVQDHNVTVTANDTEVITGVVVTDLRPEKDGEAKIVEGGVGEKNVTIELKSPAVFRGYGFHVEVYQNTNQVQYNKGNEDSSTKMTPVNLAADIKVDKREAKEPIQSSVAPIVSSTTKDLKTPAAIAKDDKDHDDNGHPIVPSVLSTINPVNTNDSATSEENSSPEQEAFLPVSDDSKLKVKTDGLTTLAKNINVNTKTTESVISSKTTPAPRNARDTNGATITKPKINLAKDNVEVKTNAPANTKVHDMTPYPLLKKDLEKQNGNTKTLGIDKIDDEKAAKQ